MSATYSPATIRRCTTILANAEKQAAQRRRNAVAKPAKADADAWKLRRASDAQMRRINALEALLGYRLSTRQQVRNAGAASDLYRSLKAEAR